MCCFSARIEEKKKKNVIKNKDHKHKTIIQRTQNNHNRCAYDINNRSTESVLNNEII